MAAELIVDWRPRPGDGVTDRAEAATWADISLRLRLADGERCLTEAVRVADKMPVQWLTDSILPLAEWIAAEWPWLVEVDLPPSPVANNWDWSRHRNLRFVGSGAAYPALTIRRISTTTAGLDWQADRADSFLPVRFTTAGSEQVALAALKRTLAALVEAALSRAGTVVGADNPRISTLHGEWAGWAARTEQAEAKRLAAWLGRAWVDLDDEQREALLADARGGYFAQQIALAGEPGLADPERRKAAVAIGSATEAAPAANNTWTAMQEAVAPHANVVGDVWQLGWHRARQVKETLQEEDADALLRLVGVQVRTESVVGERPFVAWAQERVPLRWGAPSRTSAQQRFAAARDLYAVLFAGSAAKATCVGLGQGARGLASEARAFATEWVAPWERVRALYEAHRKQDDPAVAIAHALTAPEMCVRHQLENHGPAGFGWG